MPAERILLAAMVLGLFCRADTIAPREAPAYSGTSIVNAADNQPGPLAPNAIATIYGKGLAYTTRALTSGDIHAGLLPTLLSGAGVTVSVGGFAAGLYFVSPGQINFLVPNLNPGTTTVSVILNGLSGPEIPVQIAATSPALFQLDAQTVVGGHADGSAISSGAPAKPGEVIILYATGLGQVTPPLGDREIPKTALRLKDLSNLQVTLDGGAVDPVSILYAGVSPGFAGLYQINLVLPATVGPNPEIRVSLGDPISPAGLRVPVLP